MEMFVRLLYRFDQTSIDAKMGDVCKRTISHYDIVY